METLTRTCSVIGCDRESSCKGFCRMHYKRWKRRGSAEDVTPEQRFFSYVEPVAEWDSCWIWTGWGDGSGYGRFGIGSKVESAHRWSYELLRTEIPDGLAIDHLCRNRRCVNPWHLEPVTWQENVLRGEGIAAQNARKTHCKSGHEFTEDNTYYRPDRPGCRECRTCHKAALRRAQRN
jgi:hypothetical protein